MSDQTSRLADRAGELRRAFDLSFAQAAGGDAVSMDDLLALRLGTEPYALRLPQIAGLFVDRKITRVPSGTAALLGFAGFRGAIIPVYDLHLLLGRPPAEAPRWMAIAAGAPVAVAFETFVGHLRVPRTAIALQDSAASGAGLIHEFASVDGLVRPVVDLPAVLDAIRKQLPHNPTGRGSNDVQ